MAKKKFNIKDYLGIMPKEDVEEARKALRERKESFSRDMEERRKRVNKRREN